MKNTTLRRACALSMSAVLAVTSLAGCGTQTPTQTTAATTTAATTAAPVTTEAPTTAAPETTEAPTTAAPETTEAAPIAADPESMQAAFAEYTHEQFVESVTSSIINLHYTLADPSAYGIEEYEVTLGSFEDYTTESYLADLDEMEEELHAYDRALLTADQQLVYDLLENYIRVEREGAPYIYNEELLGPTTGVAANLPVTLAEYSFYSEKDVVEYLEILSLVPGYFDEVMKFEEKKIETGSFMSGATLESNQEICESFLSNREENYMISAFKHRLDTVEGLTEEQKAAYIDQNAEALNTYIFPAYETLAAWLTAHEADATKDQGLAGYEGGAEYFTYLMDSRIDPMIDPNEFLELITDRMDDQLKEMSFIYRFNSSIEDSFYDFSFSLTDPHEILDYLRDAIAEDYPAIPESDYEINYVQEELEEITSPAFFMIPPIDRYLSNTIYINRGSVSEDTLYSTLAHEGYPGHLYQNVYYYNSNPDPLRSVLSYLGYSEGWATYVEYESYLYDEGLDSKLARFMSLNDSLTLGVYAVLDIQINYNNWTKRQAKSFIEEYFGELDDEIISEVYNAIAGDPCYYLSYYGGYLEILMMREEAEAALGSNFNLKNFHTFILDLGEVPFSIAWDRLETWLDLQQSS